MTNTRILRQAIKRSGLRIEFIIGKDQLNLSYQGFMNKVEGRSEFKASEIAILKYLLKLNREEVEHIFFR